MIGSVEIFYTDKLFVKEIQNKRNQTKIEIQEFQQITDKSINKSIKTQILVTICIIVALIFAIVLSLQLVVTRPINKVVEGLKDAAEGEGDLTKRLEIKSKDEVGSLAKGFNTFVKKLQGIITDIAGNSEKLNSASTALLDISRQMSQSTQKMSAKSSSVASAAEEMSSNLTSVAARAGEY